MKLLKRNGKGTFNLPDKLAQRLIAQGKFSPADDVIEEPQPKVKKQAESQKGKVRAKKEK